MPMRRCSVSIDGREILVDGDVVASDQRIADVAPAAKPPSRVLVGEK
jgi:hypothetical protein